MLKVRITTFCENNGIMSPLQIGFRKDNSVLDNIYVLKEIIQIYKNRKEELYLCFLDLSKAFDSIPVSRLKKKLQNILRESNKALTVITTLLDNKKYQVFSNGEKTESFELQNGISQGDSMSPILFNLYRLYLNDLLDRFDKKESRPNNDPANVGNVKLSILIYADDIL